MTETKRILGRVVAVELTDLEMEGVAGGATRDEFTLFDTNGGSDNTQLRDPRKAD